MSGSESIYAAVGSGGIKIKVLPIISSSIRIPFLKEIIDCVFVSVAVPVLIL